MKTNKMLMVMMSLLLMVSSFTTKAQTAESANYALIDMQYLLGEIPEYKTATKTIEDQSKKWTAEIQKLQDQARDLYLEYQKELETMSASERVNRETAIVAVEDRAVELQQKYFGSEGEMMKLQEKLIKPIQDKIYEAVKLISARRGYLIVFDRASGMGTIVYADPMADISNDVLAVLGYSK
ncbi:MAG: OmpH family outer membrane protein [Porphyromonas sp.]|nr:OmpH family outer membrane protein [Porphyromonas sp.]